MSRSNDPDRQTVRAIQSLGRVVSDAWRMAKPYFTSEERWAARGLLFAIIALNLFTVALDVIFNFWNSAFYDALQDKDWGSFISLLLTYKHTEKGWLPGFAGFATVYIVTLVYRTYLNQWLQISWRRWMTANFLDRWLADRAYYRIALAAVENGDGNNNGNGKVGTDNPDQRIAEDLRAFIGSGLSLSIDLLTNIVSLFSFVTILWTLSGSVSLFGMSIPGYMVWAALLYAIIGTILTDRIGRPLAALNFQQQRVEADFRFSLVRFRENMEGVALYGGETEEKRGLSERFTALKENWWAIMRRTKLLNSLISGYGQIAVIFPFVVGAPRYFAGQIALGGLMQTVNAFGQVQTAMSWFVTSYSSLADWCATIERLATFDRAIAAARAADKPLTVATGSQDDLELQDVTLALPSGETLISDASMSFPSGHSVVIGGRSGSGKSTLFRAFAGIWPFGKGRVLRPKGKVLFLPQRPYIPLGTLRHAVAYPADEAAFDNETIETALRDVGLPGLITRLDTDENWAQRLSGGEQQRLAMARALINQPDWLFLDEATASLDPDAERSLYAALQRRLPKATIVSISHRPAVDAMHDRRIVLDRPEGKPGRLLEEAPAAAAS